MKFLAVMSVFIGFSLAFPALPTDDILRIDALSAVPTSVPSALSKQIDTKAEHHSKQMYDIEKIEAEMLTRLREEYFDDYSALVLNRMAAYVEKYPDTHDEEMAKADLKIMLKLLESLNENEKGDEDHSQSDEQSDTPVYNQASTTQNDYVDNPASTFELFGIINTELGDLLILH